ncbi:MAG: hypothetical protein ACI8UO_003163 [Verrucomicrobiales bacterium]|jgi:uncharacterized protein (DUF58 family)
MADSKHDFLDPKVLSHLANLPLFARQPMLGNVSGRHRSPIKGSSLEFAQYRKYVPGDDTRRLDWRAWGRSDRFYIKEFEADTNLRMCLIVDTSGSMNYQLGPMSKLDYARRIAGSLAFLAARQGDAVGLYCAAEKFQKEIPPRRSGAHLRVILDELGSVKADGETGLADALHEAAERVQQRALMIVISDLFVETEALRSAFQHLRFRKHDVAVFHLLEKHEIDFEFERPTRFLDLEGGNAVMADPDIIGPQYRKAVQKYLSDVTDVVRDAAIDYHRVQVEEPFEAPLARFLLGRTPKQARA